ncbi:hypothetical protein [Chelativorans sp. ZYF759]|nr:hypothetical protein [Chelativorans sp. ZYF759]
MRLVAGLARFLREFDEAYEHARTGRRPARLNAPGGQPGRRGRNCHETS